MAKTVRARCTLEFKQEAVRLVQGGQSIAAARSLGVAEQTVFNWFKRRPGKASDLMFHSDRGSQYASNDFRRVLKEHGITASMSRRGDCWDNACNETLFGSLKVERLYGQKFEIRRQAKDKVIDWLLWYNRTRLHSAALDAGLCQPDELRAKLACHSTKAGPFVTRLWGKGFRGKVARPRCCRVAGKPSGVTRGSWLPWALRAWLDQGCWSGPATLPTRAGFNSMVR
jgi:hypothetical protein